MEQSLVAIIIFTAIVFMISISLLVEIRSSGGLRAKQENSIKPERKEKGIEDMSGRLKNLISDLDADSNRDKQIQEMTNIVQSPTDKLKKNIVYTLKDNNINVIQIGLATIWIIISSTIILISATSLGAIGTLLVLLTNVLILFNILNTLTLYRMVSKMSDTHYFIEQNTNHYQTAKNFPASVETTIQSIPKKKWTRKYLELFLNKMISMGNYSVEKAIEELKSDFGNSRYVDIYLNRVAIAETSNSEYKKTVAGLAELYKRQVIRLSDFARAMAIGLFTLLILTIAMVVQIMKLNFTDMTQIENKKPIIIVTTIGTLCLFIANLLYFFSTQPEKQKQWGGERL